MNILFVSDAYNVGGGERNLIEVAKCLKNDGNNIMVCIPHDGDFEISLKANMINVLSYGENLYNRKNKLKRIIQNYKAAKRIKSMLEKQNFIPDVIHSNNGMTVALAYFLKRFYNVPSFWTCHGPWEVAHGIKGILISYMMNGTFAITPEIYKANAVNYKVLIPLGIRLDEINSDSLKVGIKEKCRKFKILCVARFQEIKGQDILIRSFEKIYALNKNLELHFYGGILNGREADYSFYDDVKKYVQNCDIRDAVFFHDFDPNIRLKMLDYDLVCVPSRYESFSIVTIEAMQLGLSVIAPNIGGPSYIIENMKSGLLFEPGDVDDLADKLLLIIEKNVILDSKEIKKRASMFKVDKQAGRMLDEYKKNISSVSV